MPKLFFPLLSVIAVLIAVSVAVLHFTAGSDNNSVPNVAGDSASDKTYQPGLEHDPEVPEPPAETLRDFNTLLQRLNEAAGKSVESLLLHDGALDRAEQVFRGTIGVPDDAPMQMHRPFFAVDPEAVFALYVDLPTLERGLGLFQQHCSGCHGPYGRGNGSATLQWYAGNYPRNFWYAKYKNRSTKYGTVPTDQDLYRTLTRGFYGSTMPAFGHLSAQDRWSLVAFIKSLANFYDDYDEAVINRFDPVRGGWNSEPLDVGDEPPVTLETVTRGRILFIEQGCAQCHQGRNDKPVGLARAEGGFTNWRDEMDRPIEHSRDLTTRVYRGGAAASDLFRIISGGPTVGPMPSYQNLPIADRWSLVHYVQSIFKPELPQAPKSADAEAKPPQNSNAVRIKAEEKANDCR